MGGPRGTPPRRATPGGGSVCFGCPGLRVSHRRHSGQLQRRRSASPRGCAATPGPCHRARARRGPDAALSLMLRLPLGAGGGHSAARAPHADRAGRDPGTGRTGGACSTACPIHADQVAGAEPAVHTDRTLHAARAAHPTGLRRGEGARVGASFEGRRDDPRLGRSTGSPPQTDPRSADRGRRPVAGGTRLRVPDHSSHHPAHADASARCVHDRRHTGDPAGCHRVRGDQGPRLR